MPLQAHEPHEAPRGAGAAEWRDGYPHVLPALLQTIPHSLPPSVPPGERAQLLRVKQYDPTPTYSNGILEFQY